MRLLGLVSFLFSAVWIAGCRCDPPPSGGCRSDADCVDDGVFCNGATVCADSIAGRVCQPAGISPCGAGAFCDEASRSCGDCADSPDHPDCIDAGMPPPPTCDERTSGQSCFSSSACGAGGCEEDQRFEWAGPVTPEGAPGRPLVARFFPEGYCAERCDARAQNDSCGDCARCSADILVGSVRLPLYTSNTVYEPTDGVCRRRCTPSDTDSGCPREGYTCDLETSTCMEACVDDRQCQIVYRDMNGDGSPELIDRGPSFPAYCDPVTGRCRTRGTPGAQVGDPCADDDECMDDGACLFNEDGSGVCGIPGCRSGAVECPPGTVCDVRNVDAGERSACLPACEVGAEDGTPAMLGPGGGHPSCGTGLSCVFNGVAEMPGSSSGSCIPGNYNSDPTPEIGGSCQSDAQCYSPFGYGECFFKEPGWGLDAGMCTVRHCSVFLEGGEEVDGLLPGVRTTSPICDRARGEECVAFSRASSQTYCLQTCEDAAECQAGYACSEVLTSRLYCWPFCFGDADCRAGTSCVSPSGVPCGPEDPNRCTCL